LYEDSIQRIVISVGKSMTLMLPQRALENEKELKKISKNSNDHHFIRTEESSTHSRAKHF